MKKALAFTVAISCIFLYSCNSKNTANGAANKAVIIPGTLIDSMAMPVEGDVLNHSVFSVTIKASAQGEGKYDITTNYGFNTATDLLAMPKGLEDAKPIMQKSTTPYTYTIGFNFKNKFYDYYQVSAEKGSIEMKYLKYYSFE